MLLNIHFLNLFILVLLFLKVKLLWVLLKLFKRFDLGFSLPTGFITNLTWTLQIPILNPSFLFLFSQIFLCILLQYSLDDVVSSLLGQFFLTFESNVIEQVELFFIIESSFQELVNACLLLFKLIHRDLKTHYLLLGFVSYYLWLVQITAIIYIGQSLLSHWVYVIACPYLCSIENTNLRFLKLVLSLCGQDIFSRERLIIYTP